MILETVVDGLEMEAVTEAVNGGYMTFDGAANKIQAPQLETVLSQIINGTSFDIDSHHHYQDAGKDVCGYGAVSNEKYLMYPTGWYVRQLV